MDENFYSIGRVAAEIGSTLRQLRFWEQEGLLHPKRVGTHRVYSEEDRRTAKLIKLMRNADVSLTNIRIVLIGDSVIEGVIDAIRDQMTETANKWEQAQKALDEAWSIYDKLQKEG